jgi:hypothetical protein
MLRKYTMTNTITGDNFNPESEIYTYLPAAIDETFWDIAGDVVTTEIPAQTKTQGNTNLVIKELLIGSLNTVITALNGYMELELELETVRIPPSDTIESLVGRILRGVLPDGASEIVRIFKGYTTEFVRQQDVLR